MKYCGQVFGRMSCKETILREQVIDKILEYRKRIMKTPRHLVFFEFNRNIDPMSTQEEYLQITVINNIGETGREIRQKITRLNQEQQKELYVMLKTKFK